ncbi:two-component system response regulator [Capsulimonas corticalis]|uniref:Two-component system response regulator n=1 Tax=Capsulimonas corticalis TaxID=2219043 RepID=A0A402CNQ0_9BACT|nr:HD domain-containing phosphohydrolase [Capsulimonas corticalis]BDI33215.1 two-component system response regulator [Capsulimonas corticalis]
MATALSNQNYVESLTARPRVLVVDHEPMSRTLIDAILRRGNDYNVLMAGDAEEGLGVARRDRPDLMLLSTFLPGADGYSLCRTLKSEPRTRRIPVVMVTAHAGTQERVQGIEAGADDFIVKPFNRVELLARVRSLIRIKSLNDQLDEVEDVIYSLSRAVEAREGGDHEAHTERVVIFALAIGSELGLADEAMRVLRQAAMLRDIGKIGVPDRILNKPGALDDEEQKWMQGHVALGEQIISPLRSTAALLPIIRHHHERIDGKGYPDGLAGEEIPLGARIVAIADAFDAMLSNRPYRPALSPAKALATLQAGAGKQWDSRLVELLVQWSARHPNSVPQTK